MEEDIIVLRAGDSGKTLPMTAGRAFAWLYLGQDIKQRENISRVLGKETRHFIGNLLQEVAYLQKQPFLDFVAELGLQQKNQLYWWASDTAYRSPLTSDFFLLWCYSALFEKVCFEGMSRQKLLVVFVQDRWLYQYLWQRYVGHATGLRFLSRKWVLPETLKLAIRLIAVRGYFFLRATKYLWQSRRAAFKDDRTSRIKDDEKRIYLYSWIQDRFFPEDGGFIDAYFGRLPEILSRNGFNVTYITPLFSSSALKRKCLSHGEYEFIFLDSYINFGDILKSLFASFQIYCGNRQKWLKILLQRQQMHEVFFQDHLMYYFAFKRWLKESSQQKITIIYPFENQPWEKMLGIAASESDKPARLVGYQHSTVPSLLLNYFLGAEESSNMPFPHCIVADSDHALEILKNAGYGRVELVNGGALRYEYLYEMERNITQQVRRGPEAVLVALPYLTSLVQEMLSAVFNAFADLEDSPRIVIKFHPATSPKRLGIRFPSWPAHFEKTEKSIPEILKEVDLVICWSSTMVLEMFLAGVPVIRYCSENTIGLGALDEINETAIKNCFENDMRSVVLSALSESGNYLTQESDINLSRFFSPVNEEVWREVVKI